MVCDVITSVPNLEDKCLKIFPTNRRMSNIVWSAKPTRREVTVSKTEFTRFGATLCSIDNCVFIVHVDKIVYEDGAENSFSAAYRCGLKWGDEITILNGINVDQLDILSIYKILDTSSEVSLTIIDTPEIRTVKIKKDCNKHNNDMIGMWYKNGKIVHVAKDSPSEMAGLKKDTVVVFIGDNCVLGKGGAQLKKHIEDGWKRNGEVVFSTATTSWAVAMTSATKYVVERKFQNHYSIKDVVESTHLE
eukprot:Awhi_evm1s3304